MSRRRSAQKRYFRTITASKVVNRGGNSFDGKALRAEKVEALCAERLALIHIRTRTHAHTHTHTHTHTNTIYYSSILLIYYSYIGWRALCGNNQQRQHTL